MIAIAIGTIIMVVAVFDIHMDKNQVATMNPRRIRLGLMPISRMMRRAMRRCRFHFCIASAMMNPPTKRKMI